TTRNPSRRNFSATSRSRSRLRRNFARQKERFRLGTVAREHPRCACQKQPWTNTAIFLWRFTRSGEPGSLRTVTDSRTPTALAPLCTATSPEVPRCLIRPMRDESATVVVRSERVDNLYSTRLKGRVSSDVVKLRGIERCHTPDHLVVMPWIRL